MTTDEGTDVTFGRPDCQQRFAAKHRRLLDVLPRLYNLFNLAFDRTFKESTPQDRVVFFLGLICTEDFEQILLLGANGYGFGCQQLIRGMFERLVAASHLHRNPAEVDRFLDFHCISDYKLAREIFETFGEYAGLTAETVNAKKKLRDSVKIQFMRKCSVKGCDKDIEAFSWSNTDIVSMAKADTDLAQIVGLMYYLPMSHTHATVQSILSRLTDGEYIGMARSDERAEGWASKVVCGAHALVLHAINLQSKQFPKMAEILDPETSACLEDYRKAWERIPNAAK